MTPEFIKLEIRELGCFIGLALMFSTPQKSWYACLAESVELTRRKVNLEDVPGESTKR